MLFIIEYFFIFFMIIFFICKIQNFIFSILSRTVAQMGPMAKLARNILSRCVRTRGIQFRWVRTFGTLNLFTTIRMVSASRGTTFEYEETREICLKKYFKIKCWTI